MSAKAILSASVSAPPAVYVEDVFSTWLYTGNGSTQTITNGIDLSGEGGLVWIKKRSSPDNHVAFDTARGNTKQLIPNLTNAESTDANAVTSFNSSGFSLGSGGSGFTNESAATYASWTFREAEKFFDVVTWTGNNASTRNISHALASTPGAIFVKATSTSQDWLVWHRSTGVNQLALNQTAGGGVYWYNNIKNVGPTTFEIDSNTNVSGTTYVAYIFAHDAGGFGDSGNDNVISCGSFTTDGSGDATVTLGWEPQWVLIKNTAASENWKLVDTLRGFPNNGRGFDDNVLSPNLSGAEATGSRVGYPTASGFFVYEQLSSNNYIYIAIRRGPMKTPTDATTVFSLLTQTGTGIVTSLSTGFPVDMVMSRQRFNAGGFCSVVDRLRGVSSAGAGTGLLTQVTQSEVGSYANEYVSFNQAGITVGTGTNQLGNASNAFTMLYHFFRRAPGFFDVVAYTGTGVTRTVNHNLSVVPTLIITKQRDAVRNWFVHTTAIDGSTDYLLLNTTGAKGDYAVTAPTSSVYTVLNDSDTNASGGTYIAYLFATLTGVSKVGSYTGTGTTLQINCGFTAGARFVMIKRTDSTGDWYIWDTARGIISGNDPYLLLNSTAAEVTNTVYIDPLSSGFEISSTAPAAINANGGTYIFLSIA